MPGALAGGRTYRNPVYAGYFADPFVLRTADGYVAYGTGSVVDGLVFEMLTSPDLIRWTSAGGALRPLDSDGDHGDHADLGDTYWAPEVVEADGQYWMYYSVGREDVGHHIRVAVADQPLGPFVDTGTNLTPYERFAIDAHPFRDADGSWYLYFARDVLTGERVGTHLAVDRLTSPVTTAGQPRSVRVPSGDWQLYERDRRMYGQDWDWHTLEGPTVVRHDGRYYCFYSGGSWQGAGYFLAWAQADHPLGPWHEPAPEVGRLLSTVPGHVSGPGHASVTTTPGGADVLVYHAWDLAGTARRMCIDELTWTPNGPAVDGPSWQERELPA